MQESSGEFMLAFPNSKSAVYFCLEVRTWPDLNLDTACLNAIRQDLLIWAPVSW